MTSSQPGTPRSDHQSAWDRTILKFQALAAQFHTPPLPDFNPDWPAVLARVESDLDRLLTLSPNNPRATALPAARKVPPHLLNKTETQSALPRAKESKASRKRNVDPFSGGERAGKLAKTDAKGAKAAEAVAAREAALVASTSQARCVYVPFICARVLSIETDSRTLGIANPDRPARAPASANRHTLLILLLELPSLPLELPYLLAKLALPHQPTPLFNGPDRPIITITDWVLFFTSL